MQQSYEEAVKWYRVAAKAGNKMGMVCLAECLQSGRGCLKDAVECYKWVHTAAYLGDEMCRNQCSSDGSDWRRPPPPECMPPKSSRIRSGSFCGCATRSRSYCLSVKSNERYSKTNSQYQLHSYLSQFVGHRAPLCLTRVVAALLLTADIEGEVRVWDARVTRHGTCLRRRPRDAPLPAHAPLADICASHRTDSSR